MNISGKESMTVRKTHQLARAVHGVAREGGLKWFATERVIIAACLAVKYIQITISRLRAIIVHIIANSVTHSVWHPSHDHDRVEHGVDNHILGMCMSFL